MQPRFAFLRRQLAAFLIAAVVVYVFAGLAFSVIADFRMGPLRPRPGAPSTGGTHDLLARAARGDFAYVAWFLGMYGNLIGLSILPNALLAAAPLGTRHVASRLWPLRAGAILVETLGVVAIDCFVLYRFFLNDMTIIAELALLFGCAILAVNVARAVLISPQLAATRAAAYLSGLLCFVAFAWATLHKITVDQDNIGLDALFKTLPVMMFAALGAGDLYWVRGPRMVRDKPADHLVRSARAA